MRLTHWVAIALVMATLPAEGARAFSLAPLTMGEAKGLFQISNPAERSIRLALQVFPPRQEQGVTTPSLTPLSREAAEQIIRLRPSEFRLSSGATRTIPFTVLDQSQPFFLCGVSLQGLFTVRVCSRWRASVSPASRSPRP